MKCKGIWLDKPCPFGGEGDPDQQDLCDRCYGIGEDLAQEFELAEDDFVGEPDGISDDF